MCIGWYGSMSKRAKTDSKTKSFQRKRDGEREKVFKMMSANCRVSSDKEERERKVSKEHAQQAG